MLNSTAQLIALTIYGNLFLRKPEETYSVDFYPSNATFHTCKSIEFIYLKRNNNKLSEFPFASDPSVFFSRLKREGCQGLRLHYSTSGDKENYERRLAGQVGWGGRWLLETTSSTGSDYWESRWERNEDKFRQDATQGKERRENKTRRLEDKLRFEDNSLVTGADSREASLGKIWQVTYCRIATGVTTHRPAQLDIERLKHALTGSLEALTQFSLLKGLGKFTAFFETALNRLDPQKPLDEIAYCEFAPPDLISMDACRLLSAVDAAWVFGGIGSWNDLAFEGKDRSDYEQLSEQLYQVLNACILASANSSCRV